MTRIETLVDSCFTIQLTAFDFTENTKESDKLSHVELVKGERCKKLK